jgi:hypothetical protein
MQKINFIFISVLLLSNGLLISFFKFFGVSPYYSIVTVFIAALSSFRNYLKIDRTDVFLFAVFAWISIKSVLLGEIYAFELSKALILAYVFHKFMLNVTLTSYTSLDWVLYFSGALGLIGFLQLYSFPFVTGIRPLMMSSFAGSGGFADFSLMRPNFGLGNSLNVGLFFILNIFLALNLLSLRRRLVYICLIIFFIGCVTLTLSRAALLQLAILSPLIVSALGHTYFWTGLAVVCVLLREFIYLFFLRVMGGAYVEGSNQERIEMTRRFAENIVPEDHFFGTLDRYAPNISDSLLMNLYQSVGFVFAIVYLVGFFRMDKLLIRKCFIFILLIFISASFTNSFYAYYNIFMLMAVLRIFDIKLELSR